MNQNEYNNESEKCLVLIRELETQGRQQGNNFMNFTTDDIKKKIEDGIIPQELGEWYLGYIDEQNRKFSEWQRFIKDNPEIPEEDLITQFYGAPRVLSLEESLKHYTDIVKIGKICNFMMGSQGVLLLEQNDEGNFLPPQFFKTIGNDELGICRLIADPLNNILKLLENYTPPERINDNDNLFISQSECKNSLGDKIRLEYRFRAHSQDEANKQVQEYMERLRGRQIKIHSACWDLVNMRLSRIVTCDLTELMMIAYPGTTKESFSVSSRSEFFQDLLDLSQTQLILHKNTQSPAKTKNKRSSKRNGQIETFLLPFITIHKTSDYDMASNKKSDKYPNKISFSVLHNPMYAKEEMYNLGAGIKKRTLELRLEDQLLAHWIQVRMSQLMNDSHVKFTERDSLLKMSGLDGIKHSGMANKKLLEKFGRLKEKGIILDYPSTVSFPFYVKVREVPQRALKK